MNLEQFRAPWWQPGGHVQTIWASLCARYQAKGAVPQPWQRERWGTPDGDFIDVDFSSHAVAVNVPNVFTGPVHGFKNADDYWIRASAKPLLLLNARNDPFVPAHSLPEPEDVSAAVQLWQPPHGGHVGFSSGAWPAHVQAMLEAVTQWLAQWLPGPSQPNNKELGNG